MPGTCRVSELCRLVLQATNLFAALLNLAGQQMMPARFPQLLLMIIALLFANCWSLPIPRMDNTCWAHEFIIQRGSKDMISSSRRLRELRRSMSTASGVLRLYVKRQTQDMQSIPTMKLPSGGIITNSGFPVF